MAPRASARAQSTRRRKKPRAAALEKDKGEKGRESHTRLDLDLHREAGPAGCAARLEADPAGEPPPRLARPAGDAAPRRSPSSSTSSSPRVVLLLAGLFVFVARSSSPPVSSQGLYVLLPCSSVSFPCFVCLQTYTAGLLCFLSLQLFLFPALLSSVSEI